MAPELSFGQNDPSQAYIAVVGSETYFTGSMLPLRLTENVFVSFPPAAVSQEEVSSSCFSDMVLI